jgi:predicted short-subunit dehydrogenase-like oxidoreductase (DUF2520 family)
MSRVAVIGPGRLGTLAAVACVRAGHRVTAVAGGGSDARARLRELVAGVRDTGTPAAAAAHADLLVLAVPDDAVAAVVDELVLADAVGEGHRVIHLAGSQGLAPLRRAALAGAGVAACHPAMTVPAGSTDPSLLTGVAWAVTAAPSDRGWARSFVEDLGGDPRDVAEDRRALYHAGLSLASNAVGAAVVAARQLLRAAAVEDPEAFLAPLAHVSVTNTAHAGAVALTGPVARGDVGTVATHLVAITEDVPELADAYRHLAAATLAPLRGVLDAATVAALDEVLDAGAPPRQG